MKFIQRVFIFVLFLELFFSPGFGRAQNAPGAGINSITPAEMRQHVYFLASDRMKGRNTPSPELDSCAAYIAHEFRSYGLQPLSPDGTYFQRFNMLKNRLSKPNTLTVVRNGEETPFALKDDFVPLHLTANRRVSASLVFAGYGITAPEYHYDDYEKIDVKGKVVLVFTGEPQEKDSSSVFDGVKMTDHSKIRVKVENAMDHGAVGLILVTHPGKRFRRPPNFWPGLMRRVVKDAVPFTLEEKAENRIVCVQIGKRLFDFLMQEASLTPQEIYQTINSQLTPQSFALTNTKVIMETNLTAQKFPTQNVLGFWEGSDPELRKEVVVIGAHYDHVGTRQDTIIYNGADDNASGTAGVMEVAEAFTTAPVRPRRSLLFIAFAGEEKGLFGSRYYCENPLIPIEQTVAMLNMDMISRNDTNEVAIVGSKTSSDLKAFNEQANQSIGLKLDYTQDSFFMQSDHYSFYRKDIPVLFYFSKPTPDLHKPTDDPEKIIPEKMATIGKLVFSTAWRVANQERRPNFSRVR